MWRADAHSASAAAGWRRAQAARQFGDETARREVFEKVFVKVFARCSNICINNINSLSRGCVVFWKGHVGIMVDKVNCIHANAFHMKTTTEPLIKIINRMNKDFSVIKMMDFN